MPRVSRERVPILYLAPWVDLGGSDKGTIDWFRNLDRTRWAPSLITTQPSSNRWLHHVEPYAEELWALPDLMSGRSFPQFILGFIESRGVQVVHIMNSRIAFDLMPDMTCLRRPPAIVLQFHAEEPDRSGYARYAAARYGNLVDAFSVTSRQLATAMLDYDIASSRIHVIHSGVDAVEEFAPERTEAFADLPGHSPRVLWPGRLAEQKDPMLTLEVLPVLYTLWRQHQLAVARRAGVPIAAIVGPAPSWARGEPEAPPPPPAEAEPVARAAGATSSG